MTEQFYLLMKADYENAISAKNVINKLLMTLADVGRFTEMQPEIKEHKTIGKALEKYRLGLHRVANAMKRGIPDIISTELVLEYLEMKQKELQDTAKEEGAIFISEVFKSNVDDKLKAGITIAFQNFFMRKGVEFNVRDELDISKIARRDRYDILLRSKCLGKWSHDILNEPKFDTNPKYYNTIKQRVEKGIRSLIERLPERKVAYQRDREEMVSKANYKSHEWLVDDLQNHFRTHFIRDDDGNLDTVLQRCEAVAEVTTRNNEKLVVESIKTVFADEQVRSA